MTQCAAQHKRDQHITNLIQCVWLFPTMYKSETLAASDVRTSAIHLRWSPVANVHAIFDVYLFEIVPKKIMVSTSLQWLSNRIYNREDKKCAGNLKAIYILRSIVTFQYAHLSNNLLVTKFCTYCNVNWQASDRFERNSVENNKAPTSAIIWISRIPLHILCVNLKAKKKTSADRFSENGAICSTNDNFDAHLPPHHISFDPFILYWTKCKLTKSHYTMKQNRIYI